MKYGIEPLPDGELASAITEGVPSCSAESVGIARRSLSFGIGVAASGGRWSHPGIGGAMTAGDAPPAPTFIAFGPTCGGTIGEIISGITPALGIAACAP